MKQASPKEHITLKSNKIFFIFLGKSHPQKKNNNKGKQKRDMEDTCGNSKTRESKTPKRRDTFGLSLSLDVILLNN